MEVIVAMVIVMIAFALISNYLLNIQSSSNVYKRAKAQLICNNLFEDQLMGILSISNKTIQEQNEFYVHKELIEYEDSQTLKVLKISVLDTNGEVLATRRRIVPVD